MTLPNREERIDRYVRGELTPGEARELAQESLDDPELFEELTHSALAAQAVSGGNPRRAEPGSPRLVQSHRKKYMMIGAIAAAVVAATALTLWREGNQSAPAPDLHPTLEVARIARQPVLLADGLPNVPGVQPEIFRGTEPESRSPRDSGVVVLTEGGLATVDVGSNDGLSAGAVVAVYRGDEEVGRVKITTVFRDRARGAIEGRIRERDQVRIPVELQFAARMDHMRAAASRGDMAEARRAAEGVVQWADSAHVSDRVQVPAWNTLAALRLLGADRAGGETLLRRALAVCPPSDPAYAQILNNLGVLAELSGDRRKAADQYRSAAHAQSGIPAQAKVVESNLARVAR